MQFKRDPKMFGIILIAPIFQLLFFGYAATLDLNIIHTLIYDQDKSETSRNLIEEFTSSGFFSLDRYAESYNEVTTTIDDGKTLVALIIPKDFEKSIKRNEQASLQLIYNGSDGNAASIAAGYSSVIINDFSKNILIDNLARSGMKQNITGSITPEVRVWYNPLLLTRIFMVPGIVGLLLSIVTLILTSLAIVKEKEIGTLEQIIVTPIKPWQLIVGKLIPFMILGFVSVIIVITAMKIQFNIEVRGSIFFLFFSAFFYILSTLGLGLFVSTISKTQQQAMMIAIFAVLMPMVYLSGFAFPIENMPPLIRAITYVIPLRYFITIIRGVVLKGIGFAELWSEVTILFLMGISILLLSSLRFRKKLE